jgi:hypothetical protein
MYVVVVGHHKVDAALSLALLKLVKEGGKIIAHHVIGVNNLEIRAACVNETLIYTLTVATVFLVDDPHDAGILFRIGIGNGTGIILGTIVDDDDLHAFTANQKAFDAGFHIVLGVVAGDSYR